MAAFSVLYDRYWDRIFYIAAGKLNDHALAEDVVQDIFTDLWRRRGDLHIEGSTAAYLAVAVKYKVINIQARLQRAERYKKDMATSEAATQDSEDLLSFKELYQRLANHIVHLPEKAKIAFKLSRESGLSHKEIARVMHISEKAVEKNIARAIRSVRSAVKNLSGLFFF